MLLEILPRDLRSSTTLCCNINIYVLIEGGEGEETMAAVGSPVPVRPTGRALLAVGCRGWPAGRWAIRLAESNVGQASTDM